MERTDREELALAATIGGLIQTVQHWFPWHRFVGHELQPPMTYILGMLPIVGGFAVWAHRRRKLRGVDAITGLATVTVVNGFCVIAGYVIDWLGGLIRAQDYRRRYGT